MNKLRRILCASLTIASVVVATASISRAETPPNVVLIFADDLGYGDLGCYGATKVQTPNIDRLAAEGRRFTDAHSVSAVCTPSRYALLTGQYPIRAKGGEGLWGPSPVTSPLLVDPDQLTIADVFKNRGYSTAAFGKWHLGFKTETNDWQVPLSPGPQDLGFDYYFGMPVVNSAPPYVYVENDKVVGGDPNDPLVHVGNKAKDTTPITPIPPEAAQRSPNQFQGAAEAHQLFNDYQVGTTLAGKSVAWIEERRDEPFFLYLATTNIHHPFTPAKRFQGTSQCGLYGDFIHELDWIVGEILACLDENGLSESTLVIFTSDNGGMFNLGGQTAFTAGHRQNGELLGFKFGVWEGGHRVPMIVRWPGKVEAGTTSTQLFGNVDMLATFAAVTGQELDKSQAADSVNMLPAFVDQPNKPLRDHLVLAARKESHLSLRKGKWMYIPARGSGGFGGKKPGDHGFGGPPAASFVGSVNSDFEDGKIKQDAPPAQLYDLDADTNQTHNLHDEYPEVVEELSGLLAGYAPQTGAPKQARNSGERAIKIAATPSERSAWFDFESGKLEPWKIVEGEFGHIIANRSEFFHGKGEYNKQGEFYLSTLESSADASKGLDSQTGVIVSPLFVSKGGKLTFRVGGGSRPETYVALCTEDGTEIQTARGINSQEMQKTSWDLSPYAGHKLFLKVVDESTDGWGHITVDNFQFDAEVLQEYPSNTICWNSRNAGSEKNIHGKATSDEARYQQLKATYSQATGIGAEDGIMRRDPSDVIKVGDLYYVWYSKGKIAPGYDATVWYATSPDGRNWTEQGEALSKGTAGGWDGASVFTPNILVAEGRYWLFYTGTSIEFQRPFNPDSKIGIAVSNSPDGPWERVATNPVVTNSRNPDAFDSHLIDDACPIVRDGKYWLYFKGRQLGKGPGQTKMGLAIAKKPEGPYVKSANNPVIPGNHEVLVWPQGKGVAALIGTTGPKEITRSIVYAEDGIHFTKTHDVLNVPTAAGAFRPQAFTDNGLGAQIQWGVHIGSRKGFLPFIERFDLKSITE